MSNEPNWFYTVTYNVPPQGKDTTLGIQVRVPGGHPRSLRLWAVRGISAPFGLHWHCPCFQITGVSMANVHSLAGRRNSKEEQAQDAVRRRRRRPRRFIQLDQCIKDILPASRTALRRSVARAISSCALQRLSGRRRHDNGRTWCSLNGRNVRELFKDMML